MIATFDPNSVDDYKRFLAIKRLPQYKITGRSAWFPDEYAAMLGINADTASMSNYEPSAGLFDYQRDIARMAIDKGKFAVFADCGLGKTFIITEFARHAAAQLPRNRRVLIVSPLMVVGQIIGEAETFYRGEMSIERVAARDLQSWLNGDGHRLGITNYDALTDDLEPGELGALILDESSMLKSHYGKWGQTCIRLGKGLRYKMACTGTPAPNDRIEYANHAVFLDAFPTTNSFLARFFVNRGQTDNRWELKPHALEPFYRALSHWSIFLSNPGTYGWKDNTRKLPPIHVHEHRVDLTPEQRDLAFDKTGRLFSDQSGGIVSRSVLSQIAKGSYRGKDIESRKPAFIRELVESFGGESVIVWCKYNREQESLVREIPDAASIDGSTPIDVRERMIDDFKAGRRKVLISKPAVLGFGLNLQVATRQIFSGIEDSYESYYQAIKRSNRYGSTKPLHVHIPYTDIERPMIDTVLRKARQVESDTREQERIFRHASI